MENISKMIDDSTSSMYFSFNNTTKMQSAIENSIAIDNDEEYEQNNTLEADEASQQMEQLQTVKKMSFDMSPAKAIPKNILKAYKALSSTPTKAQLLRSVEVNRGSSAADVCDLGLAFLEAPQESIDIILSEDKENQPQESQEIICSETSSEIATVIEKTQEEEKPIKKVGFSNLPVLKGSGNSNIRIGTPKVRRSIPKNEPDLATNRPSRIVSKQMMNSRNCSNIDMSSDEIPKMLSSILKISKDLPMNRKSLAKMDNPWKSTRLSIAKTTLNSPARKFPRKSVAAISTNRTATRQSIFPLNNGTTNNLPKHAPAARKSVIATSVRNSILPSTISSPKKRIVPLISRKSMILPTPSAWTQNSRKSMASKPSTSSSEIPKNHLKSMKHSIGLKEDFICDICSRKFLVQSLFEVHKRSHNNKPSSSAPSTKQTTSGTDNKCRYCDKKFAIAKGLENHLIQNCTKIPPGDKKKLLFPNGQPTGHISKAKLPPRSKPNNSSCDSLSSNFSLSSNSNQKSDNNTTMAPPSSNSKLKKKLAHSGVYCTPNKQIMCHICKTSFNSILAFTEHKLSHSNTAASESECPTKTEVIETAEIQLGATESQTPDDNGGNALK